MSGLIVFQWDGEAMAPMRRFRAECDRAFTIGEFYRMEIQEDRSWRSHKHYFAVLHQGWASLPERYDLEPWAQSAEHLRHFALISVGLFDSKIIQCASNPEAVRWAAYLRPMKPFSIVTAVRSTVVEQTAKSQSPAAMRNAAFQQSKGLVLDFIAGLSGTTREQLIGAAAKFAQ